jgi:hypothetical protein
MQPFSTLLAFTEQTIYTETGEHLSDLQRLILQELWQSTKKTYGQIAIEHNYSGNYIQQVAAPRLWRLLSDVFGQKVTKSNVRRVLEQRLAKQTDMTPSLRAATGSNATGSNFSEPSNLSENLGFILLGDRSQSTPSQTQRLEHPTGNVPLNSPFYVSRPQDSLCYGSILHPGTLIQIKAPRQMGKTSLVTRILAHTTAAGYQRVVINFQQADRSILSDLQKLLRWICLQISCQLDLENQLAIAWDEEIGNKISCTLYLEEVVLKQCKTPIVLVLEEMSELFESPTITQDVLTMIRAWHEQMKANEIWQKLRLILVYATDVDLPLRIHQLPFNVGIEVGLSPFTKEQVEDLVQRHGLKLQPEQMVQLMTLVKGNPYLVRSLLYRLVREEASFDEVLAPVNCSDEL